MHLETIELDQVGIFTSPVRISGITPGLNVLAGANELGKSTILRGLTTLFTEQHRAAKQSVRNLRPYDGGAPFLACVYQQGGHSWRLEKRYLSAHAALLERIDGSERHQGADAENRLNELLGDEASLASVLPLLWVEQGARSFDVPVLTDGARHSIGQLLSAQAENTSGVGMAQAVLRAVEAELGQLVTEKTGRARKNSSYDKLLVERKQVSIALVDARRKASEAEHRIGRLTELQQVSADLQDPEAKAGLETQISEHEKRLRSAEEARSKLQQISERVAFLESQKKQRAVTLAEHDAGLEELSSLGAVLSGADKELADIADRKVAIIQKFQAAEGELVELVGRQTALHAQAEQYRRAAEQDSRRERLYHLARQDERLGLIAKELEEIDAELGGMAWSGETLTKLRRARARVDQALARKQASAPRVCIAYNPGRQQGFRIAGEDVRDGDEVTVDAPLAIEVEGIGRIDVLPVAGDVMASLAGAMQAATEEFNGYLRLMGASDADDAEAREHRRNELAQRRRLLLSERQALAPDGEAKLRSELSQLRAKEADVHSLVAPDPAETNCSSGSAVTRESLASDLKSVQAAHVAAQSRMETLKAEKTAIDQRRAEIAAELRVRRTRHDELRSKFASEGNGGNQRDELVALVEVAEQQLNEAVRERLAVQEVALTETATVELKQGLADLRGRMRSRGEQLAAALHEMRHIEGMLARDFEDGAGDQVSELADRAEQLDVRIQDAEEHIAALRLLAEHLRSETTKRRDAIAKPLATRLSALASRVWPDVDVPLNSDLAVDGLVRRGQQEQSDRISSGTREQIAVMARLAYADLIAESDEPLPVILDDPLVYSDDHRLEALFETMAEAAKVHQVIVLTCHERAFEPLVGRFGATRLVIEHGADASEK